MVSFIQKVERARGRGAGTRNLNELSIFRRTYILNTCIIFVALRLGSPLNGELIPTETKFPRRLSPASIFSRKHTRARRLSRRAVSLIFFSLFLSFFSPPQKSSSACKNVLFYFFLKFFPIRITFENSLANEHRERTDLQLIMVTFDFTLIFNAYVSV